MQQKTTYFRAGALWALLLGLCCLLPAGAQRVFLTTVAPAGSSWLRLAPTDSVVLLPQAGGRITVALETNLAVQARSSAAWCAPSVAASGLSLQASAHAGATPREAEVTLAAKDGCHARLRVRQLGTAGGVLVRQERVELLNNDTTLTLHTLASGPCTIALPDWLHVAHRVADGAEVRYELRADELPEPGRRQDVVAFTTPAGDRAEVVVSQRFDGYPRFAVMCDLHFGNHEGEGPMVKVPQALRHVLAKPGLDALFICGDLTDGGTAEQYADFRRVFNDPSVVPPGLRVYLMQGDHDNYDAAGQQNYLSLGQPLDQFVDIKGYPFITVSIRGRRGYDGYGQVERAFLEQSLARAAREYPGKPIFVFTHVPAYGTVYGSCAGEGGWGTRQLSDILERYPQIVLFSGHSHFPLSDPRSIHQGKFTSINVGTSTYSEIEPGVVDEGIHPDGYADVTEAVIVEADRESNLHIERWDTYTDQEIEPCWQVLAPHDGSKFVYANRTGGRAPWFEAGAEVVVSDVDDQHCTVTFPQAKDDEVVHHYVVEVRNAQGAVVASRRCFSGYYLGRRQPLSFTLRFAGVASNSELVARVTAIDSYNLESVALESEPFRTAAYVPNPDTPVPAADMFDVVWDAQGRARDVSPQHNAVARGTDVPAMRRDELRNTYVPHFSGSEQCYYRIDYAQSTPLQTAFRRGFALETVYTPDNTSNMCLLSAQENGCAGIEQGSGGQIQFFAYVGGGYKILKSSVTARPGQTYHIVAVYDAEAGATRLYIDGQPAGEMAAPGQLTFPSSEAAHWMAIGGDASTGQYVQYALQGEIAVARMYGKALSRDEAYRLYEQYTSPSK